MCDICRRRRCPCACPSYDGAERRRIRDSGGTSRGKKTAEHGIRKIERNARSGDGQNSELRKRKTDERQEEKQ